MDTDESFEAYVRRFGGARVQVEVVTGRLLEGRLSGVHTDWLLLGESGRTTLLRMVHIVSLQVIEPAKKS